VSRLRINRIDYSPIVEDTSWAESYNPYNRLLRII